MRTKTIERQNEAVQVANTNRPAIGIILMSLPSLVVPAVDAIAQPLSAEMSPFAVAFGRYLIAGLIFTAAGAFYTRQDSHGPTMRVLSVNTVRTVLIVA